MKRMKVSFALLGVVAMLLPMLALASTGTRTYNGRGHVTGDGLGGVHFEGRGKLEVAGSGTLTVSKNASVSIKGEGERIESEQVITYTGFAGSATVRGRDIVGDLTGDVEHFVANGRGKVIVEGEGKVSARPWFLSFAGWKALVSGIVQ